MPALPHALIIIPSGIKEDNPQMTAGIKYGKLIPDINGKAFPAAAGPFIRIRVMAKRNNTVIEREIRRRRSGLLLKCLIALLIFVSVGMIAWIIYETQFKEHKNPWTDAGSGVQTGEGASGDVSADQTGETAAVSNGQDSPDGEEGGALPTPAQGEEASLESQANRMAAQYDYDGAIELLKSQPDYDRNDRFKNLVANYEKTKASCTPYPIDQITHVFFHSLVYDTAKAFDGDAYEAGYNQVMTTVSEMDSILNQMYNKGYVMISLHDMVEFDEAGNLSTKQILLPPGKTPFVLSQDDCSYYHYMDGDGFPQKLVVTEDGKVKNSYLEDDGSISIGDYDVVPIVDTFVEQHPDFSYHGHKGILALTGYEGVLGYRTDEVYKTRQADRVTEFQQMFFDQHPDFNFDQEVADAKKVADAMKAEGWEFASHTWGHINPRTYSMESLQRDSNRWRDWVEPIVGPTDVLIFAFGADIGDWQPYSMSNEYYAHYKAMGFRIFCNVDASAKYWVQIGTDYLRQARRNLDGYRMYYTPDLISDLFDVDKAWDSSRPTPVPPM